MLQPHGDDVGSGNTATCSPGRQFKLAKAVVKGVEIDVFKNAPPDLGLALAAARQNSDKTIWVYNGDQCSFNDAVD